MLLYHKFPSSFAETLMNKFLIEGVTASRWIIEYLKFIWLSTLSKRELFPSDIVDKVWHLHMTYSKHYRNMIYSIKGQACEHTQEWCHKVDDGDQKQTYEDTLSFYSWIFEEPPPEDIWRSPDDEFSPNKDRFVNANLYRLTVMHYMKNWNPSFLLANSYIDRRQPRTKVEAMNPKTRNIILRRVRRSHYPYQKDQFNWRRKYRVLNEYLTLFDKQYEVWSFDKDRQAKELEKINLDKPNASGLDFIVWGGLAILMNIFNDKYLK